MNFLIIIPAHNEEQYIANCLESLIQQTYTQYDIVVVNDGSYDDTEKIVKEFVKKNPKISLKNLEKSTHQPGAKVVNTFQKGLENIPLDPYEIICKFDADIVFPAHYLEEIARVFSCNTKVGMASGLVYIPSKNNSNIEKEIFNFNSTKDWKFENISSKNHVRGPIKAYRKSCYQAMNGLRAVLGWDNIDVMLAQKNGYEVIVIQNLWVKHLRPTAYQYRKQKSEKLGEYFYNIGLNFPLMIISSLKSSIKNKSIIEFWITSKTFLLQKKKRILNNEEIRYIRNLRWRNILKSIFRK